MKRRALLAVAGLTVFLSAYAATAYAANTPQWQSLSYQGVTYSSCMDSDIAWMGSNWMNHYSWSHTHTENNACYSLKGLAQYWHYAYSQSYRDQNINGYYEFWYESDWSHNYDNDSQVSVVYGLYTEDHCWWFFKNRTNGLWLNSNIPGYTYAPGVAWSPAAQKTC